MGVLLLLFFIRAVTFLTSLGVSVLLLFGEFGQLNFSISFRRSGFVGSSLLLLTGKGGLHKLH